jgi:hypothetical protein
MVFLFPLLFFYLFTTSYLNGEESQLVWEIWRQVRVIGETSLPLFRFTFLFFISLVFGTLLFYLHFPFHSSIGSDLHNSPRTDAKKNG